MFSATALIDSFPASAPYAPYLEEACNRFGIDMWLRQVHFLSQVGFESGGFTRVVENLNYSAGGLAATFGRHRISAEQCVKYGRTTEHRADQRAIGNIVYGGAWGLKHLGNSEPEDGYHFRGRGLIQTTGRANYLRASHGLFQNDILLQEPWLLEEPRWAALAAGLFWKQNRLNDLADRDDIIAVTRRINGGTHGLEGTNGRRWWLKHLKLEL